MNATPPHEPCGGFNSQSARYGPGEGGRSGVAREISDYTLRHSMLRSRGGPRTLELAGTNVRGSVRAFCTGDNLDPQPGVSAMEVDQESRKKLVMGSVAIIAILGVGVLLANYFGLFGGRVAGAPRIIADEPLAQ